MMGQNPLEKEMYLQATWRDPGRGNQEEGPVGTLA